MCLVADHQIERLYPSSLCGRDTVRRLVGREYHGRARSALAEEVLNNLEIRRRFHAELRYRLDGSVFVFFLIPNRLV